MKNRKMGAQRGRGDRAKSVCRLIGLAHLKQQIDPAWLTDYILDSTVPVPDNDLEGHVLGINFDDGKIVSLQFRQACEQTRDARDQLKSMGDVPCELSTLQACFGSCKINHLLRAAGNVISECELKIMTTSWRRAWGIFLIVKFQIFLRCKQLVVFSRAVWDFVARSI